MKVVIAIDSFKGSLSSQRLSTHIKTGITAVYPDADVQTIPVADGGEGTVQALVEGTGGELISTTVYNPLLDEIVADYGIISSGKTAVIEMASASGLPLIPEEKRDPSKTTTFGTGQLIKNALERGCREFIIGIGGSATNDAGIGMLQALGYQFFDKAGTELEGCGASLQKIDSINTSHALPELSESTFLIACDVNNPLYGPNGAAHIYAAQKGADAQMIEQLDKGLQFFSDVVQETTGTDVSQLPGAGAAGGLGAAFVAFLNGALKPGVDIVLNTVGFESALEGTDFVITGEGKIDGQSVMGKTPVGVALKSKEFDIPVLALAGCVADDATLTHNKGIDALFSIMNYPLSLDEAMNPETASSLVQKNTEQIFRLIRACEQKFTK